jgi:hypothetical protein
MRLRIAVGIAAAVVLAGVAVGLLQRSPAATPRSGEAPSASPSAWPTPTASLTPSPPAPVRAAPQECTVDQFTVRRGGEDAGSGHRSLALILTNVGHMTCRLRGYPEVAALNARGAVVARAKHTRSGYLGGLDAPMPTVDLAPGRSASAMVEALAFNPADGSACTAYARLRITPPGQTGSVTVRWTSDGCSTLEVHPVVPGTNGSYRVA